jgi:hypothetical protein
MITEGDIGVLSDEILDLMIEWDEDANMLDTLAVLGATSCRALLGIHAKDRAIVMESWIRHIRETVSTPGQGGMH